MVAARKGAEGAKKLWLRTGYQQIVVSWNVRTLLEANRQERRIALVTRKLQRYKVGIASLSETRFLDKGQLSDVYCRHRGALIACDPRNRV